MLKTARINCVVTGDAKDVLLKHKKDNDFSRQDEALDDLLLKFKGRSFDHAQLMNLFREVSGLAGEGVELAIADCDVGEMREWAKRMERALGLPVTSCEPPELKEFS